MARCGELRLIRSVKAPLTANSSEAVPAMSKVQARNMAHPEVERNQTVGVTS